MTLRLLDTASRETYEFVPIESGKVGIYVCGLTVQSEPHVGHLRSAVNFDVLRRWLTANEYEVSLIRNVTDIDDKIFEKARDQNRPWFNLAFDMRRELDWALNMLNVLPPTYEPLATGHVPEVLALIDRLMRNGHAYRAGDGSGDVYFDVRSWPAYGELTRQRLEDLQPAEESPSRAKRDPHDFALWKGHRDRSEPDTAGWPSEYGVGRPGWHIGCSAMSTKYLGPRFDIHGGGIDLRFPHHENEQAQSRAAGDGFASHWMHNGWVTTSGEKMSKSLGNSLLLRSVLERVRGIEIRYYLLSPHYRSTIEFSFGALDEAASAFRRVETFIRRAKDKVQASEIIEIPEAFRAAMDDDLSTPAAVGVLHEVVGRGNALLAGGPSEELRRCVAHVEAMLDVLGLNLHEFPSAQNSGNHEAVIAALVLEQISQRDLARSMKNWRVADSIRTNLAEAGVDIEDTPDGTTWSLRRSP